MALKESYTAFLKRIPGIASPLQRLTFREKMKWTGLILVLYLILGQIHVFGVGQVALEQFRIIEILLGSSFGSMMTLGIGPIVTASIILQLLVGSKLIPWDLTTEGGKVMFQGTQKLLAILFSFIEALVFVNLGAVPALGPEFIGIVVLQLAIGGILVIFMDELISKWGFGSGVGLFIVAGVSKTIIVRMFNPLTQGGTFPTPGNPPVGAFPFMISSIGEGQLLQAFLTMLPVLATVIVFLLVIYANNVKVEIPLAFGSLSGFGRRWPLKFFYTSNMPVILVAALLANAQLFARMLADRGNTFFGTFDTQGNPVGGLAYYFFPPQSPAISGIFVTAGLFALLGAFIAYATKRKGWKIVPIFGVIGALVWYVAVISMGLTSLALIPPVDMARMLVYAAILIAGAAVFSVFWVSTSGMDASSVANQISSTGMQIPGYRRDPRIMESVLNRYIPALTIIGGAAVGFLAAFADFTNAIGTGTGILLATMIIYQLYEELAYQHLEDMHPALRKFIAKV